MLKTKKISDNNLADPELAFFKKGAKLKGVIFSIERSRVWIDLNGKFIGFVPKQEVNDEDAVKIGNEIEVSVLEPSDDTGDLVLSMRPVNKEEVWSIIKKAYENNESVEVETTQVNRGGMIVCKENVCGFLPVSQLTLKHYPRVEGGDKDAILNRLYSYIGKKFKVRIINFDYDPTKLIFSERAAEEEKRAERVQELKVGETFEVEITGISDFGLFIKFLDDLEGLIHISEVSWDRVDDLKSRFEIGQKLDAKVVSIENGRVALSVKRLTRDPWLTKVKKYKLGDKIDGVVKKIVPFGALISVSEGVEGLLPLSLMQNQGVVDLTKIFEENKSYTFEIKELDADNHRLILFFTVATPKKVEAEAKKMKELGLSSQLSNKILQKGLNITKIQDLDEKQLVVKLEIGPASAKSLKKALNKKSKVKSQKSKI
ncbi:MAG: S1 RNA-binding domain-containing protein [Patescibacteria group bacterium]|nr:S1 RNA-binding domain-containing protein [Patescibacteria group bacterium]